MPKAHAAEWPADKVERRAVASLVPYARNSRTHSDSQIAAVAASIREFGFTVPVLVDPEGTIIAGHCRVLAAQRLKLAEVPVMVARGWTDAQRRAYVIADNQLATQAGWNNDLLRIELADLQTSDFDLTLTGFNPGQLGDFIAGKDIEPPAVFDGPGVTRDTPAAQPPPMDGEPVDDPAGEWEGMPEFDNPNNCHRKVIVNFGCADDVAAFFSAIGQSYTENTKSIWFPYVEPRDLEGMRFAAADE